jgi:type III pantothenate kinase
MNNVSLIAVDIGNSSTKVGWSFAWPSGGGLPAAQHTKSYVTGQPLPDGFGDALPEVRCYWNIASVHREGTKILQAWLQLRRPLDEVRVLTHRNFPIATRVEFPDRVGLDRLAAAAAANTLRDRNVPAIVVDAGSAVTVDLVAADGAFEGGVILPGFKMSAQALFGADLLPLAMLTPNDEPPQVVGKNTEAAIRSGLFWGAVGAVREVVQRMKAQLDREAEIFVTGGDLRQLALHLGDEATFVPNLVLSGIAIAATRDVSPPGKT